MSSGSRDYHRDNGGGNGSGGSSGSSGGSRGHEGDHRDRGGNGGDHRGRNNGGSSYGDNGRGSRDDSRGRSSYGARDDSRGRGSYGGSSDRDRSPRGRLGGDDSDRGERGGERVARDPEGERGGGGDRGREGGDRGRGGYRDGNGRGGGGDRGRGGFDRGRGGGGDRGRGGFDRGRGGEGGDRGGRGRGGGARARGRPRKTIEEMRKERLDQHDLVVSRQVTQSKKGTSGNQVKLLANYFALEKRTDWILYHYRVDFAPEETDTRAKKAMLKTCADNLPAFIFDGSSLYCSNRIAPDPLNFTVQNANGQNVQVAVRMVAELAASDIMYLQIFNILLRKCSEFMGLEELGRHYYDRHQSISIAAHHLELWPGYKTSMRNHENGILLGVEITHKVLRKDSCLHVIKSMESNQRGYGDVRQQIKNELVGSIVMTTYNRKTYKVDDIDWEKTPRSKFDCQDREVSFHEYYRDRYSQATTDMNQPLLVSRPKKRDFHRGQTGPILLIPELCQMTGLTDGMRSNFQLMKSLAVHQQKPPDERVKAVQNFMTRLRECTDARQELVKWGLQFSPDLIKLTGRTLTRETILFKDQKIHASERADWDNAYRSNNKMTKCIPLTHWVVIVPQRDSQAIDQVIRMMKDVGEPIGFYMNAPLQVMRIADSRPMSYMNEIDQAMSNYKETLQLIFLLLPSTAVELYGAVKRKCAVDYGIPSQCFVAKNAQKPGGALRSIVTKVVVQINAKLGGEPWTVLIPLSQLMVVGFDVYHCGKRRGASVGAMVATLYGERNSKDPHYYSSVNFHNSKDELSSNLCTDISKCLKYFYQKTKKLPERIFMYRDGVGEGQLSYVYDTEIAQIQNAILGAYQSSGLPPPKFTFIVVTKRINTRIFAETRGNQVDNPYPGTVVDDVITLPERFDFYLVSQFSRQGTVSPTSYNVLIDQQNWPPDRIQMLTYKLCHSYFNWSGTVAVPAPCQYAHKLAYLTGIALQGRGTHEGLSHLLHYL